MKERKILFATLAALGAQIIFGFSFMFTKIALEYAEPMVLIANRYMVAFLALSLVMLTSKIKFKLHRNFWKLVLMSVFQPILYFLFESYGINMTTSTFSSVIISTIPVVSMLCGIFVLKEIPSIMQYLFTGISVGGVVLLALQGKADGTVTFLGTLFLIGAVFSSVAYNIASRKLSAEFSTLERTYAMTLIGMIFFVGVSLMKNIGNPLSVIWAFSSVEYTLSLLYLGVFSSVVAFLFLNFANTHLPIAKTTVFSSVCTVVSVIAGVVFLSEKLSFKSVFAILMIVIGVFGVQMFKTKESERDKRLN